MIHALYKHIFQKNIVNKKLQWLYLFDFFNVPSNLLFVFLPIYLYNELQFPLWLSLAPIAAANIGYGSLSYFGYKIQEKIGTKKFFIIFYTLEPLHRSMLFLIPEHNWIIFIYLITEPMLGLFSEWQMYNIYLAKYTSKKCRGVQFSFRLIVQLLAGAIGAVLNAVILSMYGFYAMLTFALFLMCMRIIPFGKLDNYFEPKLKRKYSRAIKTVFSRKFRKTLASQIVFGIIATGVHLWPIFIFLSLKSYIQTGSIISMALLFQILFILLIGDFTDILGRKFVLTIGVFLNSLTWIFRGLISFLPKKAFIFLGLDTYAKFVEATIHLPYESNLFDKVDNQLENRVLLDLMVNVGSIPSMAGTVLLLCLFPVLEKFIFLYFIICGILIFLLRKACNPEM